MRHLGILDRLRLLAAALLCVAFVTALSITVYLDRDAGWPVSIYPMFSEGRGHWPLRTYRVFGVVTGPDGERERRLYNADLYPLDSLRLLDGLTRKTPPDQAESLRYVLSLHPELTAVRLYDEEWEAGGETLLGRTLLVEVKHP